MEKVFQKCKENKKLMEIIFLVVLGIYYTIWNVSQPYNTTPDEEMKYDLCSYIYQNNALPFGDEECIRHKDWGISYAFQPYLSYIISAFFMKGMSLFTTNDFALVVAARFVSTIGILGFIYMSMQISKKLFKGKYKYLFIAFLAFLPLTAFLASYINNDSMALFATSIIIYSWICGLESNWKNKWCAILGVGIGFCALTYYNAYGYILCSVILCLASVIMNKMPVKDITKKVLVVSGVAILIAAWWFIRNIIIYDGDILGMGAQVECAEKYAAPGFKPSDRLTPQRKGESLIQMLFKEKWIRSTLKSLVGKFGHMTIAMPNTIYAIMFAIWALGIIGAILIYKELFKYKKEEKNKYLLNYTFILAIIIPIVLSLIYSYASDFQPQGRYVMPMIIPYTFFITKGIENLIEKYIKKEKSKNIVFISLIIVLCSISAYALFGCILPYYH